MASGARHRRTEESRYDPVASDVTVLLVQFLAFWAISSKLQRASLYDVALSCWRRAVCMRGNRREGYGVGWTGILSISEIDLEPVRHLGLCSVDDGVGSGWLAG